MTRAQLPGRFNRNGGEQVNTLMHRCTLLDEDVRYPIEDYRQGRDSQTPVGRFSMLAGKPVDSEGLDKEARSLFWRGYAITLAWVVFCVFVMAYVPN